MNATIITIGDELLIGQVIDTNSSWMAQQLNDAGIYVKRRIAVGDEKEEIIDAIDQAKSIGDVILLTGGLGPTKDDITKETLCEYFGCRLVFNEEIFSMVKSFFDRFKRPMIESNRRQAEVPENCTPIKNYNGTAPGMWFEEQGKIFVSMPGVPFEMKAMMKEYVIPKLVSRFTSEIIIHKTIQLQGIGESFLAEKISDIEDSFPEGFKLAYLPHLSIIRLRITARGTDEVLMTSTVAELTAKIEARVGEFIWGYDEDILEETIGRILLEKNCTLSTAESCTGGLVAFKITSIAGASGYFKGGVVAYSNALKKELLGVEEETLENFGAVSEEVVKQMAEGSLQITRSDYAVAISGVAGPGGGTEDKPVGTVWIAVAGKNQMISKKLSFAHSRERNMELAAIHALSLLRKLMLNLLPVS
jgi:nicotinamide-nucleotide amidase